MARGPAAAQRGRAAEGKAAAGELYRQLLETHTTKYNWAYADGHPESRTVQAGFWYVLFLLQRYGGEARPSAFYATKVAQAFPWALREMAGSRSWSPEETLARAVELRALTRFAKEFGLAATSQEDEWSAEPCQVWAGPLLGQVVRWRR